ncbi:MAG: DUF559 domain-containing protein [Chitinophagaceae bacterium]|nr:DUF559 domain-containing protein [Chitinophagaceae bacterium]
MDVKGSFTVAGNILNILQRTIFFGEVMVEAGKIRAITAQSTGPLDGTPFILPGFIDAHVHIESSMLVPSEFARLAVVHGTVGTVSDPHEIANVCGVAGVEFMIENGKTVPFHFYFGAPSCVPATVFETAGDALDAEAVKQLLQKDEIFYLSEMMNFPGVLNGDEEVMKKIKSAQELGKPVDGHAPGLRGEEARKYITAAPLNLPRGETSDSENISNGYRYQTADPVLYGRLKEYAEEGRRNPTEAEIILWGFLSGKKLEGYKFRRQHIAGNYIADFICLKHKLIIEVDGLIHELPENKENDKVRSQQLNEWGFEVIRFTNAEVINETEKVLDTIIQKLNHLKTNSEAAFSSPSGPGAVISTDHECFTYEEALDKIKGGMNIIIREGSAAKNFEALYPLIDEYPEMMMFCSDDKHPDSLAAGHINQLCAGGVAKGLDVFHVLQAACINPHRHYQLKHGLLRKGDAADFIVINNLKEFKVLQTYINGELVAANGETKIASRPVTPINKFECSQKQPADFVFPLHKWGAEQENIEQVMIIEALDGQLITNKILEPLTSFPIISNQICSNTEKDFLQMVVVNRYKESPIAKAFVKNFGLKKGAIASSVAHDSHNIIAVGVDAENICRAVNLVIEAKGGVSAVYDNNEKLIPLPVAGLMSADDGYKVADAYSRLDVMAKEMGATLAAPYMTLSFMALLVIPHLKLSDMGLFDGDVFQLL